MENRTTCCDEIALFDDAKCRLVIRRTDQLQPHPSYMRHHLAASVSKLSALAQREHFAFQEPIEITRGIDQFKSKAQFLRYAGRYVRRPPIAQRRFTRITDTEVQFWTKDLREKRKVITRYSMEDFVATLADHVPDRYWVSMKKALMPLRENVLLRLIQCISVPRKWKTLLGNAAQAREKLGWSPRTSFAELVAEMVREEREIAKLEALHGQSSNCAAARK